MEIVRICFFGRSHTTHDLRDYAVVAKWGRPSALLATGQRLISFLNESCEVAVLKLKVKIRKARLSDIPQIRYMDERVWKETPATVEMLTSRINTFPEGNIVAVIPEPGGGDMIIGYLCLMFIEYDLKNPAIKTWGEITDEGICNSSHNLNNPLMFGVNMTVDEQHQNNGIAARLIIDAWGVCIRHNKQGCLLGARVPHFHLYKDKMNIEEYARKRREDGKALDPEIRMYEREKFRFIKVVPEYIKDKESCNYGVLMFFKLPFFNYPAFIRYPAAYLIRTFGPRALGF